MHSIVLVILVPFLTTIALALFNGRPRIERAIAVASNAGLTIFVLGLLRYVDTHGIQVSAIGGYPAPYGIAFVADRLSCIMLCLSMIVATVVVSYSCWSVTTAQQRYFFYPFFQVLVLGVNWSFITGDLFNLFVAYEVMLIGSYGAMMVGSTREQVRQTLTYVAINLVGGAVFVVALGLLYALVGTLNMADIAARSQSLTGQRAATLSAISWLFLVVFCLKAGAFPLFFWLPDSYPVVPAGINGYFAGLLTKVGVYSLLRVFVMVFQQPGHGLALEAILSLAGFTMVIGVLGALCQWETRRILSWHIISQVGYMLMGIGLAAVPAVAPAAVAATVFYVVHHIIVKASLFLIGDMADHASGTRRLKESGGLLQTAPILAAMFLIAAFSLAGLPPFSGFVAKLVILKVGLASGHGWTVTAAVVTSFLTLLSMTKIWSHVYWGESPRPVARGWRPQAAPTAVLVAVTLFLGIGAQPVLRLAHDAARDLVDPSAYIAAVLGTSPLAVAEDLPR